MVLRESVIHPLGQLFWKKTPVWIRGMQGLCLAMDLGMICDRIVRGQLFGSSVRCLLECLVGVDLIVPSQTTVNHQQLRSV